MAASHDDLPNDAFGDADRAAGVDVDWLAFRYAAGELDGAELAAFEQMLAESQPAREQVAAAVELFQAIAECGAGPPAWASAQAPAAAAITVSSGETLEAALRTDGRRRPLVRPHAWLGLAAAVVLAAIWLGRRPSDDDALVSPPIDQRQAELAAAWASWFDDGDTAGGLPTADSPNFDSTTIESPAGEEVRGSPDARDVGGGGLAAADMPEPSAAAVEEPSDVPLDAPDWMLAALGGDFDAAEQATDDADGGYEDMNDG